MEREKFKWSAQEIYQLLDFIGERVKTYEASWDAEGRYPDSSILSDSDKFTRTNSERN